MKWKLTSDFGTLLSLACSFMYEAISCRLVAPTSGRGLWSEIEVCGGSNQCPTVTLQTKETGTTVIINFSSNWWPSTSQKSFRAYTLCKLQARISMPMQEVPANLAQDGNLIPHHHSGWLFTFVKCQPSWRGSKNYELRSLKKKIASMIIFVI